MAYGAMSGGEFTSHNKKIPGTYINFISAKKTTDIMSERGKAAFPIELDWGSDKIIRLERDNFPKKAFELFGYDYKSEKLAVIREVFCHATEIVVGRINHGGVKAKATIDSLNITAKYAGIGGNNIKVIIQSSIDNNGMFDVITYIGTQKVDKQTVQDGSKLQNNAYVEFSGADLTPTAGINLTAGTNGDVTGENYSAFLEKLENEKFNVVGYFGTDDLIKSLFVSFVERMRKQEGIKIQGVLFDKAADTEGIISVKNSETLIPWVLGAEAGASITQDNTNKVYDGKLQEIPTNFNYESEKEKGHLLLYQDGSEYRVLEDMNSLISDSEEKKQADFSSNKVIRTLDQIAIDTAMIFNQFHLGKTANTATGRGFLKEDIVKNRRNLEALQAIEDFDPENIQIQIGEDKKSVILNELVKVSDMMKYLYMTVEVQ